MFKINKVFMVTIGLMAISWLCPSVVANGHNGRPKIISSKEVPNTFDDNTIYNEVEYHPHWDSKPTIIKDNKMSDNEIFKKNLMTDKSLQKRVMDIINALDSGEKKYENFDDPQLDAFINQIINDEDAKNYLRALFTNPEIQDSIFNLFKDEEVISVIKLLEDPHRQAEGLEILSKNENFIKLCEVLPKDQKAMEFFQKLISNTPSLNTNIQNNDKIIKEDSSDKLENEDAGDDTEVFSLPQEKSNDDRTIIYEQNDENLGEIHDNISKSYNDDDDDEVQKNIEEIDENDDDDEDDDDEDDTNDKQESETNNNERIERITDQSYELNKRKENCNPQFNSKRTIPGVNSNDKDFPADDLPSREFENCQPSTASKSYSVIHDFHYDQSHAKKLRDHIDSPQSKTQLPNVQIYG